MILAIFILFLQVPLWSQVFNCNGKEYFCEKLLLDKVFDKSDTLELNLIHDTLTLKLYKRELHKKTYVVQAKKNCREEEIVIEKYKTIIYYTQKEYIKKVFQERLFNAYEELLVCQDQLNRELYQLLFQVIQNDQKQKNDSN